jgi:hypothetical protein
MRYMVRKSIVQVIGGIWWPYGATCAMQYELDGYQVENATDENGKVTRESVQRWIDTNTGDFSTVIDWTASIELADGSDTVELPWTDEESEFTFNDAMYGSED